MTLPMALETLVREAELQLSLLKDSCNQGPEWCETYYNVKIQELEEAIILVRKALLYEKTRVI